MSFEKSFRIAGVALALLGVSLFLPFAAYLAGLEADAARPAGFNGVAYYLGATAGSAIFGWGTILLATATTASAHRSVALGTGLGFAALSLMRFLAAIIEVPAFADFAFLLPLECVGFMAASLWFLHLGCDIFDRARDGLHSLLSTPAWVQIWLFAILIPLNLSSYIVYALWKYPFAGWAALGFTFVAVGNMTLCVREHGLSKASAMPHLAAWVPLQIYAGYVLVTSWHSLPPVLLYFTAAYFAAVGISNIFDVYDTFRWFKGERAVIGREDVGRAAA